ncbi:MAG: hypothetical protein IE923_18160 [Micrococcales bacterium]|nr:hypothetical protein [Micrococcales bacterium]
MSDDAEPLADLRDDLDRRAQVYARAADAGPPVAGADETGQLSVLLGADGRLHLVRLTSTWRNVLAPADLGPALVSAVASAATARLRSWAEQVADDDSTPVTRPAPPRSTSLAADLADIVSARGDRLDARHAMRSLAEMLREVNAELDTALEQVQQRASREHAGRSADGHVRAWADGSGSPVRVEVDEGWAARAHGTNISREMTQAVHAAAAAAGAAAPASLLDGTALGAIAADVADARGLAARLGVL